MTYSKIYLSIFFILSTLTPLSSLHASSKEDAHSLAVALHAAALTLLKNTPGILQNLNNPYWQTQLEEEAQAATPPATTNSCQQPQLEDMPFTLLLNDPLFQRSRLAPNIYPQLLNAIQTNNTKIIETILTHQLPAVLNVKTNHLINLLQEAIKSHHSTIFIDLFKKLSKIHDELIKHNNELSTTLLHIAATENQPDIIAYLLQQPGITIDPFYNGDNTPLSIAIIHNHTNIIKSLLNAGANINTLNNYGNTVLYTALEKLRMYNTNITDFQIRHLNHILNFFNHIHRLLQYSADIHKKGSEDNSQSPFEFAINQTRTHNFFPLMLLLQAHENPLTIFENDFNLLSNFIDWLTLERNDVNIYNSFPTFLQLLEAQLNDPNADNTPIQNGTLQGLITGFEIIQNAINQQGLLETLNENLQNRKLSPIDSASFIEKLADYIQRLRACLSHPHTKSARNIVC